MNEIGGPVKALLTFYKVEPDHLVVVHDELDLPFGTHAGQARRRRQRPQRPALGALGRWAPATSTGCASASAGRTGRQEVSDFVLSNYSATERKDVPFQVYDAADAVESLLTAGLARTQQEYNS